MSHQKKNSIKLKDHIRKSTALPIIETQLQKRLRNTTSSEVSQE